MRLVLPIPVPLSAPVVRLLRALPPPPGVGDVKDAGDWLLPLPRPLSLPRPLPLPLPRPREVLSGERLRDLTEGTTGEEVQGREGEQTGRGITVE